MPWCTAPDRFRGCSLHDHRRTDTGKTTTLLKILAYQRRNSDQAAFISDDMTIVAPNEMALTYPKPLTISYHTLRAVKHRHVDFQGKGDLPIQSRIHSRSGRRFAFLISKTHLPVPYHQHDYPDGS